MLLEKSAVLVRIKTPSPNLFSFLNGKQFHSVNVQIICDAQNHTLNVLANYFVGVWLDHGAAGDGCLIGKCYNIIEFSQVGIITFQHKSNFFVTTVAYDTTCQPSDPAGGGLEPETDVHSLSGGAHHWHTEKPEAITLGVKCQWLVGLWFTHAT